jgi:EAL domain-containing protein (putative c-di-GMP-specific phosphodiesterase class I)/CheY-like chemotaxis protein
VTLADCTVMVVEDHEFQRLTTLQILANLGAGALLEAEDGAGALALLDADPRPDIVVCDLDMPGMDGVEFLRQLSELGSGTAIVIASGLDDSVLQAAETTARGYGLEVLGAIRKPLTARLLLQAVGLHRPGAAEPAPARAPGADPWAAALREQRVRLRLRPRADLASGRVAALEVRACRVAADGACVDAAGDPAGPAAGSVATEVAELVARAGLAAQPLAGAVDVALVLAPGALAGPAIVDRLAALAAQAGVDVARICVVLLDAPGVGAATPLDVLTRLRVRGFGLGIDGFGSSHTTFRELAALPLTEVTIAADALAPASASERGAQAFAATVQALAGQGLQVDCDGCDTAAAWELALRCGCRRAQGALAGPALAPAELPAWLRTRGGAR